MRIGKQILSNQDLFRKKRDTNIFKESLEKELNYLQVAMDSNPSQITQDSYYTNKKELEQIEKEELNSIIFKYELKWTEDGEKHSKYFLALEKHNYLNKVFSKLEIDEKIMANPADISRYSIKILPRSLL